MNRRAVVFTAILSAATLPAVAAELLTTPSEPLRTPSELRTPAEPLRTPAQVPALDARASRVVPADAAFALTTSVEADGDILFSWNMPPSFYLYRKSLKMEHDGDDLLPALELPEASIVTDEFFGESAVYFERLIARLPAGAVNAESGATFELQMSWQGCLQDTYCYPPQHKTVSLTLP